MVPNSCTDTTWKRSDVWKQLKGKQDETRCGLKTQELKQPGRIHSESLSHSQQRATELLYTLEEC